MWLFLATACTAAVAAAGVTYDPPVQNFTQKIDHASNDNATFLQRYQIDTTHFKPGGPILFHQSEETDLTAIADHVFSDYAHKVGGIAATLEHRYFGGSFPYNLTGASDIRTNLKKYSPLTIENILQDAVEFVNFIRRTVPGAQDSKVIYSGTSYGGFLAVIARVRYPETFYGSFALSPAIRSLGAAKTLEENPFIYASTDMAANIYWDANAEAARKIRDALKELDACVKNNSCATAIPDLNFCNKSASTSEWATFQFEVVNYYWILPQFDYGRPSPFPSNSLAVLVNQTLEASTTGQVLRLPLLFIQPNATSTTCIDLGGNGGVEESYTQGGVSLAFLYIICQFFILSEYAVAPDNTLFPSTPPDLDPSSSVCPYADEPWVTPDLRASNARWEEKLNITDAVLDATTRLVIVNGALDRTTAVGTPALSRTTSSRDQSRAITVVGMAHGESAFSEANFPRGIRPQVDEVGFAAAKHRMVELAEAGYLAYMVASYQIRDTQLAYIQEWLMAATG